LTLQRNTDTGKNEEKEKEDYPKNKKVDMSHLKTFLHFGDFQFYLAKIILSEIWIFRLTNLTEKSKTKNVTQNNLNEKEIATVVNEEKVGSNKENVKVESEKSKEDEKKNQAENDKKTKSNFSDGRKKSLSDRKKDNKDKDNQNENDNKTEHGDHEEKDGDRARSPQKRTVARTIIDEEKVIVEVRNCFLQFFFVALLISNTLV
jgi:hypothetical protein